MLLGLLISGCICGALLITDILITVILYTGPKKNDLTIGIEMVLTILPILLAFGTILLLSLFGAEYSEIKNTVTQISMIL